MDITVYMDIIVYIDLYFCFCTFIIFRTALHHFFTHYCITSLFMLLCRIALSLLFIAPIFLLLFFLKCILLYYTAFIVDGKVRISLSFGQSHRDSP